jgi:hypothetical protein
VHGHGNRVAQKPRYKLSYDARTTRQYTLFLIFVSKAW